MGANIDALCMLNSETIIPWVQLGHKVFNQLERLSVPTIARVEGFALGGGLELAMACDFIVATPNSKFGQPEARLGLVAGWGGSFRLPQRVGRSRAKELFFTGKTIVAHEAHEINLIDFVGESEEIDSFLETLLDGIGQCSTLAVSEMKSLLNSSPYKKQDTSYLDEALASVFCLSDQETKARIQEFLDAKKV